MQFLNLKQLNNFVNTKYFIYIKLTENLFFLGFENLTRAFIKARPVIDKEENGNIPKFYIRCLVELEDFITDVSSFLFLFL